MTPKMILQALLALMLTSGMAEAQYAAAHVTAPLWWLLLSGFLSSFLPYYWYRLDSERRHMLPPRWMSSAVVVFAPLGFPAYLARSRPPRARLPALGRMCLFLVKMLLAFVAGVFAFYLMPGVRIPGNVPPILLDLRVPKAGAFDPVHVGGRFEPVD